MDMPDNLENSTKIKPILMDFGSEDVHHKIITQRNLNEIVDNNNSVVDLICNIKSDAHLIKKGINIIDNLNSDEQIKREKQTQSVTFKDMYIKRSQSVAHLENQLKKLKHRLQKLKEANKIDKTKHQSSVELFQNCLQDYKLYFGYEIKIEDKSTKTKFTIIINFKLDDGTLSHPIKFIFDKKDDSLFDFNASDLMTNKQKKALFNNFHVTKNYLALFYAVRSCAMKKDEKY